MREVLTYAICGVCRLDIYEERLWDDHFFWTDLTGSRLCRRQLDGHDPELCQTKLI